jgi:hypothetical protein
MHTVMVIFVLVHCARWHAASHTLSHFSCLYLFSLYSCLVYIHHMLIIWYRYYYCYCQHDTATGLFSHLMFSIRAQVIRLDQILQGIARCHCCYKRKRLAIKGDDMTWLPPRPGGDDDTFVLPSLRHRRLTPRHADIVTSQSTPSPPHEISLESPKNSRLKRRTRFASPQILNPGRLSKVSDLAIAVQGRSAGMASRTVAWLVDQAIIAVSFLLTWAMIRLSLRMTDWSQIIPKANQTVMVANYTGLMLDATVETTTQSREESAFSNFQRLIVPLAWFTWVVVYNSCSWAIVASLSDWCRRW